MLELSGRDDIIGLNEIELSFLSHISKVSKEAVLGWYWALQIPGATSVPLTSAVTLCSRRWWNGSRNIQIEGWKKEEVGKRSMPSPFKGSFHNLYRTFPFLLIRTKRKKPDSRFTGEFYHRSRKQRKKV